MKRMYSKRTSFVIISAIRYCLKFLSVLLRSQDSLEKITYLADECLLNILLVRRYEESPFRLGT